MKVAKKIFCAVALATVSHSVMAAPFAHEALNLGMVMAVTDNVRVDVTIKNLLIEEISFHHHRCKRCHIYNHTDI